MASFLTSPQADKINKGTEMMARNDGEPATAASLSLRDRYTYQKHPLSICVAVQNKV